MNKIKQQIVNAVLPYIQAIKNDRYLWGTLGFIVLGALLAWNASLLILGAIAFIQNMAFTASSRSRNSANPQYHYRIACISNSVWFMTNYFLILDSVKDASFYIKVVTMVVYTVSTAYGSMLMMDIMLKKESGINKVGATK